MKPENIKYVVEQLDREVVDSNWTLAVQADKSIFDNEAEAIVQATKLKKAYREYKYRVLQYSDESISIVWINGKKTRREIL